MISVQGLSKQYGIVPLFHEVSFSIGQGERVGLVGRNGHGKTTLFRILVGEETPDSGEVIIPHGYRIGYLSQRIETTQETVLEEAATGLPEAERDALWRVEEVLMGLGFSVTEFSKPLTELSGGYLMRVMLAKTLVSEPQLLLLDEPTNFLDIVSIRWFEEFLLSWRGELVVITHDRTFMDKVVTHVMGIHRGKVRKLAGQTEAYYEQIAREEDVYEKQRINEERRKKQVQEFISKFRAKARQANLVQSRIQMLEKMEAKEKLHAIETLSFSFPVADVPPKTLLRAHNLSFSYTGSSPYLINGVDLEIEAGDTVCVIGKNGKGKTTFLKLLVGELTPLTGTLKQHAHCSMGYYEQGHTVELNAHATIEEELLSVSEPGEATMVRTICGAMMFSGDHAYKKISVLSGGEKCRVLLGKLLVSKHNMLLLDEPTHHLDMESCDAIIRAIQLFEGASIIVTHDERFLHAVATKLVVFTNDGIRVFPGTYQEFLEQVGWEHERVTPGPSQERKESSRGKKVSKHERALFVQERSRVLKPLMTRIEEIEKEIVSLEKSIAEKNELLIMATQQGESAQIQLLSCDLHAHHETIEHLFEEMGQISHTLDEKKKEFAEREKKLEK